MIWCRCSVPSCGLATITKKQSRTIPIVVQGCGSDMVTAGLATSLARPGGNITESQILGPDLIEKRLQVLKELLPNLSRLRVLGEALPLRRSIPRLAMPTMLRPMSRLGPWVYSGMASACAPRRVPQHG